MSAFDDKLRDMAHRDRVPLPEGYEEMLQDLYQSLAPEGPANPSGKERVIKRRIFPRLTAVAVIAALMAASMAVGALAFASETVVEVPVPTEQEALTLDELGLTLIFPDSWKGRYEVVEDIFAPYGSPMWTVCVKSIYDAGDTDEWGTPYVGMLFVVFQCADVPLSREAFADESGIGGIGRYLLATENGTYAVMYATDVQFDTSDPEKTRAYQAEYSAMAAEIKDIRVVVDNALA